MILKNEPWLSTKKRGRGALRRDSPKWRSDSNFMLPNSSNLLNPTGPATGTWVTCAGIHFGLTGGCRSISNLRSQQRVYKIERLVVRYAL